MVFFDFRFGLLDWLLVYRLIVMLVIVIVNYYLFSMNSLFIYFGFEFVR